MDFDRDHDRDCDLKTGSRLLFHTLKNVPIRELTPWIIGMFPWNLAENYTSEKGIFSHDNPL